MNKIILSFALIFVFAMGFTGCKTTETKQQSNNSKHNLSHIETKNRYMLASELPENESLHVAIINIVLPQENTSAVSAELTFGSFRPRDNGKVYIQANTETVRYQSMTHLVDAISVRSMFPPIGIFMLVDDIPLGTEAAPSDDFEIMMFTRELDSLLEDEDIKHAYLLPDTFTISYK